MRILAVIRQTREYKGCLQSIRKALAYPGVDQLWMRTRFVPAQPRYEDGTRRLQVARSVFLGGPWDAMLVVDDDLVLPPDTMDRLLAVDGPVVMGLTVRRTEPYWMSAIIASNGMEDYVTLDKQPDYLAAIWGGVIPVKGCGHNPTLIRREVLDAIPFRRERGNRGADRFFAYDCEQMGFQMWCDTGLLVGHFDGQDIYEPHHQAPYVVRAFNLVRRV